ncbi:PREDICTED: kinesin-like protein KIN-7F isoform X2 [Nelumbo nucifera]|uniref:Kinesin-like protein n=1 Tax=Nelumbo nucifera TaxID=4432 RepID=A0A1U8AME0_NELNU|nr:PREDICTED: kinesin-like protein KIN-7F isoform X2 [Nelumbo nucifera]
MGAIGREELMGWEKTQEKGAQEEKIFVSVRLRPLNAKEIARHDMSDWECINDNTIICRNNLAERSMYPAAYTFDRVFRCDCSTKEVYELGAKEVALSVVSGINSSIFAYGQTSSGKTYTMSGITEYTVADIYDYIHRHGEREFVLKFSAMEIYNEAVRDLLGFDSTPLRLLDDPERGTVVERLTEETLRDWSHLQELLCICEAQRQIGETSLNETSSRSHQILRLTIESSAREFLGKDNSSTLAASVDFVDLAGSERASQALSAGARLKEGCHINRSLLTLGTVIRKLSKGRTGHIPFRDSKLTRILQPSLGGNARTAIICTMSPARSHVEQSRNTLLFASCANKVATNAQVNVVMSDKALVKHLQKELARLESELRSTGPTSTPDNYAALLREKDLQIEKMEKEINELTQQRDLAQSQLERFLQVVGDSQTPRRWDSFNNHPKFQACNAWEDESDLSGLVYPQSSDVGGTGFNISQYSDRNSGISSNNHFLQLPKNSEDHLLNGDTSSQLSISSHQFDGLGPGSCQNWEEVAQVTDEDNEDLCKEVRCIEMEESSTDRNVESNALSPEENDKLLALTENRNRGTTEELISTPLETDKDLKHTSTISSYDALEQKLQDMQKTIACLVNPYPDEPSPWPPEAELSSSRGMKLTRSQSCRATLMTSSSSWFGKQEQNQNTPQSGFEKVFPGRLDGFQKNLSALNYGSNTESLSGKDSQNSEGSASTNELKADNVKTSVEDVTSIQSFVEELKEMAKLQYDNQAIDGQETEPKADKSGKTVKDVGLDPVENSSESPSWPLEFERQRKEIIELWNTCNVSLVHRTYFFLLFIGDPADSIYMKVELRRLSFLRDIFSSGNLAKHSMVDGCILSPASRYEVRNLTRLKNMIQGLTVILWF